MPSGPIRRAQLITPFGVGALVVTRDGISVISTGLDHWFKREDGSEISSVEEFVIREWRLERQLGVSHFRLPPDFRITRPGQNIPNSGITVPFLRFPQWHFCPSCNRLYERPLAERGKILCQDCLEKGRRRYLYQVPFIAICDAGHIQDFPWREWVHQSVSPKCNLPLRLIATGGASLAGQIIKCDCGMQRSLAQITSARPGADTTELTANLDKDGIEYRCQGLETWNGTIEPTECGRPIRGSLRSASNVYFAVTRSSIYLPRSTEISPPDLISLLENPPVAGLLDLLLKVTEPEKIKPEHIRAKYPQPLGPFSDAQIQAALDIVMGIGTTGVSPKSIEVETDDQETRFRRMEYSVLKEARNEPDLVIKKANIDGTDSIFNGLFSKIMLIEKLRETRALVGFTRVIPDNGQNLSELKRLLWRNLPDQSSEWLPAYVVHGEGIFLELSQEMLNDWESKTSVIKRTEALVKRYETLRQVRGLRPRVISPRLILVHTIAHLLINRLTFECGYSSASLRERLYISDDTEYPMAALLIYTAAGDAEGTLGGLVRMGNPKYFTPVLSRAIEGAMWCSADPVCMEVGMRGGQGPDSCNLAACHNCALVPETACEEFNRFLDRGMVIGTPEDKELGYFQHWR